MKTENQIVSPERFGLEEDAERANVRSDNAWRVVLDDEFGVGRIELDWTCGEFMAFGFEVGDGESLLGHYRQRSQAVAAVVVFANKQAEEG